MDGAGQPDVSTLRENKLLRIIFVLWLELERRMDTAELEQAIRSEGLGWTLPSTIDHHDADDWLTVDQLAFELGYTPSAIRNWPARYGLRPVKGRFRWGDVKHVLGLDNTPEQPHKQGK